MKLLAKHPFEKTLFVLVRSSAIALPALNFAGFLAGGWSTYIGFSIVFGFYFLVEILLWASGVGVATDSETEFRFLENLGDLPLLIYAALYLAGLAATLALLPKREFTSFEMLGVFLSLAATAGSVGGLVGHEFIHRRAKWKRMLGLVLFGSVNYAHFGVSHIHGHHKNVGTRDDWSTARRDETIYHFLYRALVLGYVGGWKINRGYVIRTTLGSLAFWGAILALSGLKIFGCYLSFTLLAVMLNETVNYLSHYGLVRKMGADGKLEPLDEKHTWESNNKVTNWFIFNAGKHSHHHKSPSAGYDALTLAYDKAPLPYGLPMMTLIALVPPLYFRIMNGLLDSNSVRTQKVSRPRLRSVRRPRETRIQNNSRRSKSS